MQHPFQDQPSGRADLRALGLRAAFAVLLWGVAVVGALWLEPLQIAGVFGGLVVGLGLLFRPTESILALLGLRVIVDLMSGVSGVGLGLNIMQVFSAGAALGAGALFLMNFERIQDNRALPWFAVLAGMFTVGLLRHPGMAGVQAWAKFTSPFLMLFLAAHFFDRRDRLLWIPATIAVAGVVPVAYSVYSVATGQNFGMYAGTDRLLGAYDNPTHHALTMALLSAIGVFATYRLRRRWWSLATGAYTLAALIALHYSYTRAAQIAFAVFVLLFLWRERRYRWMGIAVAVGLAVFLQSEITRQRFLSLGAAMTTLSPLEDPTQELGSGRWIVWQISLEHFFTRPPWDWVLGMGMGMEAANPLGMNPHNDYLSLLYQAGPAAVVAFVAINVIALRRALQASRITSDPALRALAHLVLALGVAGLVTDAVTNGFVSRTSPAWYLMSILGLGFAVHAVARREQEQEQQAREAA